MVMEMVRKLSKEGATRMLFFTLIVCPIAFLFVVYGVVKDLYKQQKQRRKRREEYIKKFGVPPCDDF